MKAVPTTGGLLAGNDTIKGGDGAGFDYLYGGTGADLFVFSSGIGLDIVYDFEDGIDLIEVVGLEAGEIAILAYGSSGTELRSIYGDRIVVLKNFDPADITEADLLFT